MQWQPLLGLTMVLRKLHDRSEHKVQWELDQRNGPEFKSAFGNELGKKPTC